MPKCRKSPLRKPFPSFGREIFCSLFLHLDNQLTASRYVVACPEKNTILYEGDRVFELKVLVHSSVLNNCMCFCLSCCVYQAPSSEVKMFQDLELSAESGRSHVPSQASKAPTSIASSSINLRKQLLLVMRQLSEDIESVRKRLLLRLSRCCLHL